MGVYTAIGSTKACAKVEQSFLPATQYQQGVVVVMIRAGRYTVVPSNYNYD